MPLRLEELKFSLSPELEQAFFRQRPKVDQMISLKKHLEQYQDGEAPLWKSKNFLPYSSYLGFITALKVKSALQQLDLYGYLDWAKEGPVALIDVGAGTAGASLGAYDYLKENQFETQQLMMMDQDLRAVQWAYEYFGAEHFPKKTIFKKKLPPVLRPKRSLILFANVLAEIGFQEEKVEEHLDQKFLKRLQSWMKAADEESIFVFIEPANFILNQNFLRFRDWIKNESQVLLPCTHQMNCPALKQNEWCHEELPYKAPTKFWELVKGMGFKKKYLTYSFLCLGKQKNRFSKNQARVVSSDLRSKGVSEKWLCGNGERWKERRLLRNENDQTALFYDAKRGSILDLKLHLDGAEVSHCSRRTTLKT